MTRKQICFVYSMNPLLGPISHPEIEERVAVRVSLKVEYQKSLSPYDKFRNNKEDDVSSFVNVHILGLV